MKKILIYGGTTEGRRLAEILCNAGLSCQVQVATEYGEQVLDEKERLAVCTGRLNQEEMKQLYKEQEFAAIVDATHPFATVVTENIFESVQEFNIPLLRLGRDVKEKDGQNWKLFKDISSCIEELKKTTGNILLTTGSKDLAMFCQEKELKDRLVVRVLPGMESLGICYENGLEGRQIIAMQGPFSCEMNIAQIKQYQIEHLVSKESGRTGGVDTKLSAVEETGIIGYLIQKPENEIVQKEYSLKEICQQLSQITKTSIISREPVEVVLAGIGMGDLKSMTEEVRSYVKEADYIFGAERMLKNLETSAALYPYYLKRDILPMLEKISNQAVEKTRCVVLFSGDSGFFSGCEKLYHGLQEVKGLNLKICPGISSMSYFCAKLGISWQDAGIISLHGVSSEEWRPALLDCVRTHEKTFFLTSGIEDVKEVARLLKKEIQPEKGDKLYLGYQLSYEEETIIDVELDKIEELVNPGLYVGMILKKNREDIKLTPGVSDEIFQRDKVPMTKEEVREVAICKMNLTRSSVVYDIGCGTGSVAIEMANISSGIKVYGIESNEVAVALTKENAERFGVQNLEVVEGMAPEAFMELPAPTHAFIGGTRGQLPEIMDALYKKNSTMRVVITAISLESIAQIQQCVKKFEVKDFEVVQLSVSKAKAFGAYHLMQGNNPVFIFSFTFGGTHAEQ